MIVNVMFSERVGPNFGEGGGGFGADAAGCDDDERSDPIPSKKWADYLLPYIVLQQQPLPLNRYLK